MTTFRFPVVVLALAASFGASLTLGSASAVPTDVRSVSTPANVAATAAPAGESCIASAFPTAEAGFAIARPVAERVH